MVGSSKGSGNGSVIGINLLVDRQEFITSAVASYFPECSLLKYTFPPILWVLMRKLLWSKFFLTKYTIFGDKEINLYALVELL